MINSHRMHNLTQSVICRRLVRYKLEGPPSRVRVQQPWEKVFVLVQASVGRISIDDYALRQEMSTMTDYLSRMLSALEEYSIHGTRHGKVAMQSLLFRRSLAAGLWNGSDGVLQQLNGVSPHINASLKLSGISTFKHVLETSAEQIDKAAQRAAPFGMNLRDQVSALLSQTLKVTAELEYAVGSATPCTLICSISRQATGHNSRRPGVRTPALSYTLVAYTDQANGCVIYKRDISKSARLRADTPPKFGKMTVALIASVVGLDGTSLGPFQRITECFSVLE